MADKMLVTQALDERDLLVKKIQDKIANLRVVDVIKKNEERVCSARITREEYAIEVQRSYQQILDLIQRFNQIDAAIVASNAQTRIMTSYGEYTVAAAISLRSRLRGGGSYDGKADFELALQKKMKSELDLEIAHTKIMNDKIQSAAENMRLSILGKDCKTKDDKPLAVVDAYVNENTAELVDPLNVEGEISKMKEKRETLLTELDTQIKVSNATTYIEL